MLLLMHLFNISLSTFNQVAVASILSQAYLLTHTFVVQQFFIDPVNGQTVIGLQYFSITVDFASSNQDVTLR